MLTIGLTGGVASGKSEVSHLFGELGATVIDTDRISRQLVEPGEPALQEIVSAFGTSILNNDGALNRKKLGKLIFNSEQQREQLEDILHPRIRDEVYRQLQRIDAPYAIVVIPLLLESRYPISVDHILVVDAPLELKRQRLMQRDAISDAEADMIIQAQATNSQRLAIADDVISNLGTLKDLQAEVKKLHQQYLLPRASQDGMI
jgi:dephospho-CoA kinase